MFRRLKFLLLGLFIFSSFFLPQNALAQTQDSESGMSLEDQKMMIAPNYPRGGGVMPFAGQNHNYSVVFRGNGESIVTLRVSLTNTNEKSDLKEVMLRVPKITDPKDLSAYQILVTPPCVRYDDRPQIQTFPYQAPKCVEYGEPDYYYYYGGGKYQKAESSFSGDNLKVTLPTPIRPNRTGSFFVYFRGFGYASKNIFGAYTYNFETLKVADQINQINLGISTDADQYLKGAKGEVQYRSTEAVSAMKMAPSADAGAIANTTVDRFVQQIGQGAVVKTASNLASMESYKVNGMYANSRLKLYYKELATTLSVVLVIAIFILLVVKMVLGKKGNKDSRLEIQDWRSKNILIVLGTSFVSSLVAVGYSALLYFVSNAISAGIEYQFQIVASILLIVVSFAIYALILVVPAIFIGYKKGLAYGIWTFVTTIVWLVIMGGVVIFVLFMVNSQPSYPIISPMMKSVE